MVRTHYHAINASSWYFCSCDEVSNMHDVCSDIQEVTIIPMISTTWHTCKLSKPEQASCIWLSSGCPLVPWTGSWMISCDSLTFVHSHSADFSQSHFSPCVENTFSLLTLNWLIDWLIGNPWHVVYLSGILVLPFASIGSVMEPDKFFRVIKFCLIIYFH